MKGRYIIGALLSTVLLICNQVFIQYWLQKKHDDATILNIAGHQRALSQIINLEFYKLHHGADSSVMFESYNSLKKVHFALLNGNIELEISRVDSPEAIQILETLTSDVEWIGNFINDKNNLAQSSDKDLDLKIAGYYSSMNHLLSILEENANHKLNFIIAIELILVSISIVVLLLEVRFIYYPLETIKELQTANIKLNSILSSSKSWYLFLNKNLNIYFFNNKAKEFNLFANEIPLKVGNKFSDCINVLYKEELLEQITIALQGQKVRFKMPILRNEIQNWFEIEIEGNNSLGVSIVATDITKSTEDAIKIQEVELKYKILFDTMAQGVVYQDHEGKIIQSNPASEKILGINDKEILHRNSNDPRWQSIREDGSIFPGDAHPGIVALKTGRPVHNVIMGVYNPQKDKHIWVQINAIPLFRDNETMPYQVYTTFTNVTRLKAVEESLVKQAHALRESEEFLQNIIDNSSTVIYVKDLNGNYKLVNKKWEELTGNQREQVIGKNESNFYSERIAKIFRENDLEVIRSKEAQMLEEFIITPEGEKYYYISTKFPIKNYCGEITGVCGISTDITERKEMEEELRESEERFRSLFEKNTLPMFLIQSGSGKIFDANPAAIAFFGWDKDVLLNKNILELYASPEELQEKWTEIQNNNNHKGKFFLQKIDGIFDAEVFSCSILIEGVRFIHQIISDVTIQNRYFEAVKVQNEILKEIAWAQSHLVRAPLARIMGLVSLLEDGDLEFDEDSPIQNEKDVRKEIIRSANELDKIISDISKRTYIIDLIKNDEKFYEQRISV
jgi:PAS domain S-box-containing protein